MYVSEQYEVLVKVARTSVMMAKILKEKYGVTDSHVVSYLEEARRCVEMAREIKSKNIEVTGTIEYKMVA